MAMRRRAVESEKGGEEREEEREQGDQERRCGPRANMEPVRSQDRRSNRALAKMAGLYRKEELGEEKPRPWTGEV